MKESIRELMRANEAVIQQALTATTQVRVADLLDISETAVSRFKEKDGQLQQLSAFAAAAGVRFVRADASYVAPEHLKALKVLAALSFERDAGSSGWGAL